MILECADTWQAIICRLHSNYTKLHDTPSFYGCLFQLPSCCIQNTQCHSWCEYPCQAFHRIRLDMLYGLWWHWHVTHSVHSLSKYPNIAFTISNKMVKWFVQQDVDMCDELQLRQKFCNPTHSATMERNASKQNTFFRKYCMCKIRFE